VQTRRSNRLKRMETGLPTLELSSFRLPDHPAFSYIGKTILVAGYFFQGFFDLIDVESFNQVVMTAFVIAVFTFMHVHWIRVIPRDALALRANIQKIDVSQHSYLTSRTV